MAKQRKRDLPRLDETMSQGVGNEPQPSDTLPEAVVGQTEHPREGLGQPDEEPGITSEYSGHSGTTRNGRGAERAAREDDIFGREEDA